MRPSCMYLACMFNLSMGKVVLPAHSPSRLECSDYISPEAFRPLVRRFSLAVLCKQERKRCARARKQAHRATNSRQWTCDVG